LAAKPLSGTLSRKLQICGSCARQGIEKASFPGYNICRKKRRIMMKFSLLMLVLLLTAGAVSFADGTDKAEGYWKSISDKKGEAGKITAYWKITVNSSGNLEGVIVHCPGEPEDKTYICDNKDFNGKTYVNTVWIRDMKKTGPGSWAGGTIVDVSEKKGDVYGCEIKVSGNGNILEVRGFIGVSIFGRTQFWQRSGEDEVEAARDSRGQ
jgi:uncharacterized protein (DUF2147 family)